MRYPGILLGAEEYPGHTEAVCQPTQRAYRSLGRYGRRAETRREHIAELQAIFGFQPFTRHHYRQAVYSLDDLGAQTDKGIVLAMALVESLRNQLILLPSINVIERICSEAVTRATRRVYRALTAPLTDPHRERWMAC